MGTDARCFSVAHTAEEYLKRSHLCSASKTTVRPQDTSHSTETLSVFQHLPYLSLHLKTATEFKLESY